MGVRSKSSSLCREVAGSTKLLGKKKNQFPSGAGTLLDFPCYCEQPYTHMSLATLSGRSRLYMNKQEGMNMKRCAGRRSQENLKEGGLKSGFVQNKMLSGNNGKNASSSLSPFFCFFSPFLLLFILKFFFIANILVVDLKLINKSILFGIMISV